MRKGILVKLAVFTIGLSISGHLCASDHEDDSEADIRATLQEERDTVERLRIDSRQIYESHETAIGSSLVFASANGFCDVVRVLIDAGSDIDSQDINGVTPLIAAAHYGHSEVIELLLQAGADLEKRTKNGATALIMAVRMGFSRTVTALVDADADMEAIDCNGMTPLIWAAISGCHDVARILVDRGADLYHPDPVGYTCLDYAMQFKDREMTSIIVDAFFSEMGISFSGGDGRSFDSAIVIEGVGGDDDLLKAECLWLCKFRPDWVILDRVQLGGKKEGFRDLLECGTPEGHRRVFFNVDAAYRREPAVPRQSVPSGGKTVSELPI